MTRSLLLTFDAFGTLFHPRSPIPIQYAASAASFNITVSPAQLQSAFKAAYEAQSRTHPNYGRDLALRGQYPGPRQWWEDVIRASFRPHPVPAALVDELLDRFTNGRGYALYDDVRPFFEQLRLRRRKTGTGTGTGTATAKTGGAGGFGRVVIGVVSNSDDRVPVVLESLGVRVGDGRGGEDARGGRLPGFEKEREERQKLSLRDRSSSRGDDVDVDFVVMSYHAGAEKPDALIFDVARRHALEMSGGGGSGAAGCTTGDDWEYIHVGDDYKKDYRGALDAGWKAYFLPRDGDYAQAKDDDGDVKTIQSLLDLIPELEMYK